MISFLKHLFTNSDTTSVEAQQKSAQRNFDILKYDGIRALKIGKWIYAEKCFKEAVRIQPEAETMSLLVQTSIQLNKLEQAHDVLAQLITIDPKQLQNYFDLARVCYLEEKYDEMLARAQESTNIAPDHERPYFLQAQAYYKLGDLLNTIVTLTQAISKKEDFSEALLMRGKVLIEMRQYNEAQADIEVLLKQDSNDEETLLLAGEIQSHQDNDKQAIAYFDKVIELNPFSERAYEQIASLYGRAQQWDLAIDKLTEAIEINATAHLYQLRGRIKLEKGDKDGSLADIKKALELDPKNESTINGQFNNFDSLEKSNNPLG